MNIKLLTENDLKFLSVKGGCTGSSESTLVKMPHCWKSHVTAPVFFCIMSLFLPFEAAILNCPEMIHEGALWFPNLLVPDATMILPVMIGSLHLLNNEVSIYVIPRALNGASFVLFILPYLLELSGC